ncbi:MAG: AAA family ATPase [Acidimicrobiales bacterium]
MTGTATSSSPIPPVSRADARDAGPEAAVDLAGKLFDTVAAAVRGKDDVVRLSLVALLAGGHLLVEDLPGTGKTLLAKSLATALGGRFGRIQCTPDLLPSDITGTSVYAPTEGSWTFRSGPVFANVVLVDEINRASPKTQSGLLECMQERHVTVDKNTHDLARPFIVLATQNPIEYEGTYPLPEAQLDRFMVRVSLGYPSMEDEQDMLAAHSDRDRVQDLGPVTGVGEMLAAQAAVASVHGSEALRRYIVSLMEFTRADPRVELGASPRAGLMLFRAAKALAALDGRDHALPDDVKTLAPAVLTHRLLLAPEAAGDDRSAVVGDALERVPAL